MTVTILIGDALTRLKELPDDSVDIVVTSPPYWGLRNYDVDGQLGLEPTLGEHLTAMVEVFREVRRVLKPTGTVWLNYGDCYATSPNGRSAADTKASGNDDRTFRDKPFSTIGPIQSRANGGEGQHHDRRGGVLKPKDLCMIPNRLAIALQEAGWWVRSEIIWAKPNPMPESIKDRPATAHEKIFLLTKSARYFYNDQAVRQTAVSGADYKVPDGWDIEPGAHGSVHKRGRDKGVSDYDSHKKKQAKTAASAARAGASSGRRMAGFNEREATESRRNSFAREGKLSAGEYGQKPQFRSDREPVNYEGSRSLRNYEPAPVQVWNISTQPFSEAHFATFPPELAVRCLAAGCPDDGMVLDPFGGAGTVALVAAARQLDCTLIELNPEYAALAKARIEREVSMFSGEVILDHAMAASG